MPILHHHHHIFLLLILLISPSPIFCLNQQAKNAFDDATPAKFIYASSSVAATTVVARLFLAMSYLGFKEMEGENLNSKLFLKKEERESGKVRRKIGMMVVYTPSFLLGVYFLIILPFYNLKFTLVRLVITLHFFRRLLEVMFVHKYSGSVHVVAMVHISINYFLSTILLIFSQLVVHELHPEPVIDLNYIGIPLFLLGIVGNFYHNYLLSKFRNNGEKEYKIPRGGLFSLVICPHYLFEILEFWGIFCVSQTLYAFLYAVGTIILLVKRSYAVRKWYESKFEDFPNDAKILIPYVF